MPVIPVTSYRCENLIVDHKIYPSVKSFPPHIHDAYELLFLTRGEANYTVDGKTYYLTRGSLVITRPMSVHSITFHTAAEYERYDILFDADILSSDICALLPDTLDVVSFAGNSIISELFRKMDYYCANLSGQTLNAVLKHLTEEVLVNVSIAACQVEQNSEYTANPLVKHAVAYIDRHLTQALSVEQICAQLHITQSYLLHLFKKHLNISPKKYIMSKRLATAQMALRAGAKPVDVYKQCGFFDYSTFFRAYRNHFGHSPSAETSQEICGDINS